LENWRNFTSVDIPLQRRVFITGPNASGKSNFLDALRFLQDIASSGGGLQSAVSRRHGLSSIRCLAARRYPNVVVQIEIGESNESAWSYGIDINQDNQRRPYLKRELVTYNGDVILDRPDHEDEDDAERLFQTHLEQVNANKGFREIVEFLSTIKYLHVVPQLIRDPDRSVGKLGDPFGGDLLEQIARTPKKTLDSRLARITQALQVAVPQLQELRLERDVKGTPHLSGLYTHWRPKAGWQSEGDFSDGTLRLLGLLWAVLSGGGPLLLEEPELSLNPAVVRHIPQMFARVARRSGRQIFVSTHSTELLSDPGIEPEETILLQPSPEGTMVSLAASHDDIVACVPMAEAVFPYVSPENAEELAAFGER
jgi:predicted ATPase